MLVYSHRERLTDSSEYCFNLVAEEDDLDALDIEDGQLLSMAREKLLACAVGKVLHARRGFNRALCNMYGFRDGGNPVWFAQTKVLVPVVAMVLDAGDPATGRMPVPNPEYADWEKVARKVELWSSLISRRFFSFVNTVFFGTYSGGWVDDKKFKVEIRTGNVFDLTEYPNSRKEKKGQECSGEQECREAQEVPETMPGIWKLIGHREESFYDFGKNAVSPAGKRPSLYAAVEAYRKTFMLTVARALLCRMHGVRFTTDAVVKSARNAWKGCCMTRKYREVLKDSPKELWEGQLRSIDATAKEYIEGRVPVKSKYLSGWAGKVWSVESFVAYMKVSLGMKLKESGWRSSKPGSDV